MVGSPVEVFRLACIEAKIEPLASMDGPQAAAVAAKACYEQIVQERLEEHHWPFAKWEESLVASGDTVPEPWTYSFVKPASILIIHAVRYSGRPLDYEIRRNRILTRNDTASVVATWRAAESEWPATFTGVIVRELAAKLRLAVKKDDQGAFALEESADMKARRARVRQKRQQPGKRLVIPRLVQIYLGRNGTPPDSSSDV